MMMFPAPPLADTEVRPDADPQKRPMRGLVTGVVLSLLLHVIMLLTTPPPDQKDKGVDTPTRGPLMVQLTKPPPAAPDVAPPPPPVPVKPPPPQRSMMATAKPNAQMPVVPLPPPEPKPEVVPPRDPTPQPMSFSDLIAARRAQRQAQEDQIARYNAAMRNAERDPSSDETANSNIRRNLQSLTRSGDGTSGVFRITHKGTRTGAFAFRGWTGGPSSAWNQTFEVDAGQGGNVELAIVKKMIELIRMHYQGNFNWESNRLGRVVVLSARLADNAGLEEFIMREFFELEK